MNKFKIEKIKALQDEIFKLQNENIDPLFNIRKQIENKEYDLDEIMYKRMKKYLLKNIIYDKYCMSFYLGNYGENISINDKNIQDRTYKEALINWNGGYKDYILRRKIIKFNEHFICGMNPFQKQIDFMDSISYTYNKQIFIDILLWYNPQIHGECISSYYIKQLYKIWVKL